ncbi:FMN-binding protein [Thiomicrorhabdus sp.]|uniref:FMN-binding protein n=1 Tax=Thiomicrorhabdus sp. TaxID=2039724 RepID=UPI0029C61898|nr:FMN-binding protein [Thiomicrorhabdus sp.]
MQRNFVDGESVVEKKIWLIGDQKKATTEILGHPYHQLRVTYWTSPENTAKSVWILQEIGKERFIDVGIVIESNEIRKLEILAFRESRGWEVKLPFFTAQFDGNRLTKEHKLEKRVDAITGATLSWRAVTGVAKMALYLNGQRPEK